MNYIISAHGGKYNDETVKTLTLPGNVTIKFYVQEGEELSNDDGLAVVNHLRTGSAEPHVVETLGGGSTLFDYYYWYLNYPHDQTAVGEFSVSGNTVTRLDDLRSNDEGNPKRLSDFIAHYCTGSGSYTIYWAACRTSDER